MTKQYGIQVHLGIPKNLLEAINKAGVMPQEVNIKYSMGVATVTVKGVLKADQTMAIKKYVLTEQEKKPDSPRLSRPKKEKE